MKKIAFISSGYLPLPSAKGGAVETLIDTLTNSEKVNQNYQIDVYSVYDKEAFYMSSNQNKINYIYIRTDSVFNKINKITRYIINKYTHRYIGNDYISKIIKKYYKKLQEYDYVIVENKPEFGLVLRKYVKGKLLFHSHNDFLNKNVKYAEKILKTYDQIYALSKFICKRICEINKVEAINKVRLLYNGINIENFEKINEKKVQKIKQNLKIRSQDIVILYTGRLVQEKGVKELIQAFNNIKNDMYKLVIIGSIGSGLTGHNAFTNELYNLSRYNKNIIFTGYIRYDQMPVYYKIADVGVIPSIWEEPFALTVIEHLAAGHPVIITNSGAMPELINDEVACIVENDDNIINNLFNALLHVKKNRKKMKDKCLIQAKKFDKSNYINKFLELLSLEGENDK